MPNLYKTKKVLKKVYKQKEDNLVKLHFDLYYRKKKHPDLEGELQEIKDKIKHLKSEIDKERVKGKKKNKTKIVEIEGQIKQLEEEGKQIYNEAKEIEFMIQTIKQAKDFNATIKECIQHPEKIYEEYISKEKKE